MIIYIISYNELVYYINSEEVYFMLLYINQKVGSQLGRVEYKCSKYLMKQQDKNQYGLYNGMKL